MLRTERLLLRKWRSDDLASFARLNADPEVMRYFPSPLTREQSNELAQDFASHLEERGWGIWAVEVKDRSSPLFGKFIGFAGLAEPDFDAHFTPVVEVGWRLSRAAWGKGYATEAARAALEMGFAEVGLEEIVSMTAAGNIRSRSVMESLGMTHDPADDFAHPAVPEGDPLREHVLYRLQREPVE